MHSHVLKGFSRTKLDSLVSRRMKARCDSCLLLRGCVNLNSPCTVKHFRRLLGKHSSCEPSHFGDMVSLCRFLHVDRNLTTTGRLPQNGGKGNSTKLKSFNGDPKLGIKVSLDSFDRRDDQQLKEVNVEVNN